MYVGRFRPSTRKYISWFSKGQYSPVRPIGLTDTVGLHADMTLSNIIRLQNHPELILIELKLFFN